MQDRVLDPADILRDRKPLLGFGPVERFIGRLAGEADEVPARVHEGIERVGLARGLAAATRALNVFPRRVAVEWVAGLVEVDVLREHYRQLVARDRPRAALFAMDDRDRRAPVALPRHAPVAQTVLDGSAAPTGPFSAADDLGGRLFAGQPIEEAGVDRDSRRVFRLVADRLVRLARTACDDSADRQVITLRKFKIPLVV